MPSVTDREFVEKMLEATRDGRIAWVKSDVADQFSAGYGGKWSLKVDRTTSPNMPEWDYWVALFNAEGEELLRVTDGQVRQVGELFEAARRQALKVNDEVADLIKKLDGDIPF
jgi:hypothetical protein